jgi:hypothetical protein
MYENLTEWVSDSMLDQILCVITTVTGLQRLVGSFMERKRWCLLEWWQQNCVRQVRVKGAAIFLLIWRFGGF